MRPKERLQLVIDYRMGDIIEGRLVGDMGGYYGKVTEMNINLANLIVELVNGDTFVKGKADANTH